MDILEKAKTWDRCYPGNLNIEKTWFEMIDEIERLRIENSEMKKTVIDRQIGELFTRKQ